MVDRIDELDDSRQSVLPGLLESDRQAGANGIGVIVISTMDLDQLVHDNRLRPDLLHRLKGGAITLAPLRSAPDVEKFARKDLTARSQSGASKIEAALRYNGETFR